MQTIDLKRLNISPHSRVLDLGCGQGRHAHAVAYHHRARVWGLDLDFDSARQSQKGFELIEPERTEQSRTRLLLNGDCLALPFSDQAFDIVICSEVLEHLPDYHSALLEMRRVLKAKGLLALSVPSYWPERICWALSPEYRHDPGGHLRIFKTKPLTLEIKRLGFSRLSGHHAHALHSPYWWLKCFNWAKKDSWRPIRLYHRFLVWEMTRSPRLLELFEKCLNPLLGKSVVLYFQKIS
ncbi:MAG: class I SAM-dependent methyltransferase [Desulfohalobiaceae bacterium]|nr:class I SAM-dependent methyltransferase [Desulfohalobiaceae bacterium]